MKILTIRFRMINQSFSAIVTFRDITIILSPRFLTPCTYSDENPPVLRSEFALPTRKLSLVPHGMLFTENDRMSQTAFN